MVKRNHAREGSSTVPWCRKAPVLWYRFIQVEEVDFQRPNNKLVLNWTNVAFTLQSAHAITGTFTNIPGATSPFTNPITGAQQYFRLKGN